MYLRLDDLAQLPGMTTYEYARMKALESNGLDHEAAKAQIYAERGASGEPKIAASPGDPVVAPAVAVAVAQAPVASAASGGIPWFGLPWGKIVIAGAGLGLGVLVMSRLFGRRPDEPVDAGDAPTGIMAMNGKMTRGVVYAPGETGWVENLRDQRWRIANVPMTSRLNIDDVVARDEQLGRLTVGKVLERVFPKKSAIHYPAPHEKTYKALSRAFRAAGWKLEGGVGGVALLAHDGRRSPEVVAREAGVEVEVERLPLKAV